MSVHGLPALEGIMNKLKWEITLSVNDGEYHINAEVTAEKVERGAYGDTIIADGVEISFGAPITSIECP